MIWDFDMHTCWNRFYKDKYGVRTRFLKMMDAVSAHFGSNPAVLGYDILNEPWGDEVKEIAVLYEDAAKIIRKNDPDSVLFLCPHALISAGNASELPKMSFGNYAYAPHYYDGSIIVFNVWFGTSPDSALNKPKEKSRPGERPITWGGIRRQRHGRRRREVHGPLLCLAGRQPRLRHPVELHPRLEPGHL